MSFGPELMEKELHVGLQISLNGSFDASVSPDLRELADLLRAEGVHATPATVGVEGSKSAIMIGLSIASLTMSSISTTITVLNFWQSQKKKRYRVVLHDRGQSISIADLASEALERIAADSSPQITIEKV
ncbi:hypothetical protein [Sphingomonas melonis]|uniref:hypothetical protein n=1 Tax=Sphingomonas melonis TaxID=152682 RepID=UPI0015CE2D91|nr:hypothetical protein [Sphingomonas melonis]